MNSIDTNFDDREVDYQVSARQAPSARTNKPSSKRPQFQKRRGKSPQQFNGIHRRRKKKIRW